MTRAWVALALGLLWGCGAYDDVATPQVPAKACPTVDETLTTLTGLAEAGQLRGLQQVVADDLTPDTRRRLVHALLSLVEALPDGTFEALQPLATDGSLDALIGPLGGVLGAVNELGEPAYGALHQAGRLLQQCTGRPLLVTLGELLRDPAVRAQIQTLVDGDLDLVGILDGLGVDLSALQGREGFQALVHNVLAVFSQPDVDLADHLGPTSVLALVVDLDEPTVQALTGLLQALLAPGPARDAVQQVTRCVIEVDRHDELAGLAFDLLRADLLGLLPTAPVPWPGGVPALLDQLLLPVLDHLAADDVARRSWVVALDALLRPEVAARALPDVHTLVSSGALGEVIGLLGALVTGDCP